MIYNFSVLSISKIFSGVAFLFAIPVIVRELGIEAYGKYTLFQVYAGILLTLFSGLHGYALYALTTKKKFLSVSQIQWHNIINHFIQSIFFYTVLFFICYILNLVFRLSEFLFFYQLALFIFAKTLVSIIETQFTALEKFTAIAMMDCFRTITRLILVIILSISFGLGIALYSFAIVEILLLNIVFFLNIKRISFIGFQFKTAIKTYKHSKWLIDLTSSNALKFILGSTYNNAVNSFTFDMDKIIIERILGLEALGIYQLAFALFARISDLISVSGQVLLPKFLKIDEPVFYRFLEKRDNLITIVIGLCATIFSLGFSDTFYQFWLTTPDDRIIFVFNIMAISFIFVSINQLTGNELVRRNMQHVNGHIKLIITLLSVFVFYTFGSSLTHFSFYQLNTLLLICGFQLIYIWRAK